MRQRRMAPGREGTGHSPHLSCRASGQDVQADLGKKREDGREDWVIVNIVEWGERNHPIQYKYNVCIWKNRDLDFEIRKNRQRKIFIWNSERVSVNGDNHIPNCPSPNIMLQRKIRMAIHGTQGLLCTQHLETLKP